MIIGLTGLKGCGKSTVAEIMRENYGYYRRSFAEPIKDMLQAMGLTKDELYDPKLKEVVIPEFGKSIFWLKDGILVFLGDRGWPVVEDWGVDFARVNVGDTNSLVSYFIGDSRS